MYPRRLQAYLLSLASCFQWQCFYFSCESHCQTIDVFYQRILILLTNA